MDRHLILLGLFYAANGENKTAEGLYRDAIAKMDKESSFNYSMVMAKSMYGRLLMRDPKREKEAIDHLKQSESLANKIPFWWNHLDHIYIQDFKHD